LTEWIDQNEDKIRSFMLDLVDYALLGAEAFGATAKGVLDLAEWLARATPDMMRFAASVIDMSDNIASLWKFLNTDIGTDAWFAAGLDVLDGKTSERVQELEAAADRLEGTVIDFDTDPAKKSIDDVIARLGGVRETIEALRVADAAIIEIKAELKAKDVDAAKATIAALSEDQLVTLIASIDPSNASKTEKKILELAKERKVDLETTIPNRSATERNLDWLARDRTSTIKVNYTFAPGWQIDSPSRPRAVSPMSRAAVPGADTFASGGAGANLTLRATSAPNVTIVNNYPKPERTSDSLAMSLRLAREAVA
jgi:hypothetical protein